MTRGLLRLALVGLCAFAVYRCAAALIRLAEGLSLHGDLFRYPAWGAVHFASGALFACLVPLQLWTGLRGRHRSLHRWAGRTTLASALVMAMSGIGLAYAMPQRPLGERAFMTTVFVLFLSFATMAWRAARARDFERHREWVTRMVAGGLAAITQRLVFIPFAMAGIRSLPDFWDKFVAAAWLASLVNLAVAEWVIATRRRMGRAEQAKRAHFSPMRSTPFTVTRA